MMMMGGVVVVVTRGGGMSLNILPCHERLKARRTTSIHHQRSLVSPTRGGQRRMKSKTSSTTIGIMGRMTKEETYNNRLIDDENVPIDMKDYIEHTKIMIKPDEGPPRWFSPLESRLQWNNSPLLLYLPGLDGTGLGILSQHQRLGKVFDIWCLHIPVKDRTPFKDLVKFVEATVKAENCRSPNRPIYLVGEDIGGCLALVVAARSPTIDLVLLLANPATSYGKSHLRNLVPFLEAIPKELNIGFPCILAPFIVSDPLWMVRAIGQKKFTLPQNVEELSENLSDLLSSISVLSDVLPRDSLLWKLKLLESASSYANSCIYAVKAQTLILASGKDQWLPSLEEAERLHKLLPSCQMRSFKDSGHSLFMEDGFDFVSVIKGAGCYRRTRYVDYVTDFIPPTPSVIKRAYEPYRWIETVADPVMLSTLENGKIVRSLEGIPHEGPVLFVGYHLLMGLEVAPIVATFLLKRNIMLRVVGHPILFQEDFEYLQLDPSSFDTAKVMGGVPVSARNLYRLLANKSHVLLHPGGVREALHRKGEENKLFWPIEAEFVRVAARFGAKIVPLGVIGADDLLNVVLDIDDYKQIPYLKTELEKINDTITTKLRVGAEGEVAKQDMYVPVMLPKFPGRFYMLFGKPIETEGRMNELRDKKKAHEVYMNVKSEVERSIKYLKEKREKDPYRTLLSRLVYQSIHGFTSEIPTFEL